MENDFIFDFIIIGSGPSASISAKTLSSSKASILMLDVGYYDNKYQQITPEKNYEEIRQTTDNQHVFFLGDKLESIPQLGIKVGAQLTPSRKMMINNVQNLIPLISKNFLPMESLGYGGLGAGWGLGCYAYNKAECEKVGLKYSEMKKSYQFVADHIGISAGNDDVKPYILNDLENIQPPLKCDNTTQKIFDKYNKNKKYFKSKKIHFGLPSMAILTENKDKRKATSYFDMDFYSDINKSAYRPQFTIEELKLSPNFEYKNNQLVVGFKEKDNYVEVKTIDIEDKTEHFFKTKKLIIAAGALGTARIVLRSIPEIKKLPLLCNPYTYLPGIQYNMLGKKIDSYKSSMAQAMMIFDSKNKNEDFISLAFYTYQSLMLFRLIEESPLNIADNRKLFQYLQSSFVITGIHHPDSYSELKYLELEKNNDSITGDILKANYELTKNEKEEITKNEKIIKKALFRLGIIPIKKINTKAGGSIHYAGTVPFSDLETIGKQSPDGKLYSTKNVYIADSSGFNYLPAKGVTLSLMANAHRICKKLIENE